MNTSKYVDEIFRLPLFEQEKIAGQILTYLNEAEVIEEDEETIKMLDKRWADIESGKAILLTEEEFKQKLKDRRLKK
jgi:putative addiction module component (TIGR02574 family)